jgi:YjbE family integral membrane protein
MAQFLGGMPSAHWAGLIGALIQVALIDITLASDNAVAVGMAASGLPQPQRHRAIMLGLGGAVILLCALAFFAVKLLKAGGGGLILGGGLLLLLICWQMWRDLRRRRHHRHQPGAAPGGYEHKTLLRALTQIFLADISTSLDNVLAVAGVVRDQPPWVLFLGLALSVVLTGFAAAQVARLLHRWPWIGYIGLVVVLFVAGQMIWDGSSQLGWARL